MLKHKIIPNISVDCVIFGFDFEKLNVLLVERILQNKETKDTLIKDYTLAGYHIYEDEELDAAASSVLKSLTGLDNIYLEQFYTFGGLYRVLGEKDKLWLDYLNEGIHMRVITVGYFALIDNTKVKLTYMGRNVKWYPVSKIKKIELAFDHAEILEKALEALRNKVRIEPIAFELLPYRFTLTQVQLLFESILGVKLDKRNFRKKILQLPYIIPLNEKQKNVTHKPAQLFLFSKEVYEKTKKERLGFLF